MKVSQLIERLKDFDPELEVCVRGYESGVDSVGDLVVKSVLLNHNTEWYYGSHEVCAGNEPGAVEILLLKK